MVRQLPDPQQSGGLAALHSARAIRNRSDAALTCWTGSEALPPDALLFGVPVREARHASRVGRSGA
jgi:hypothetical protein